MARPAKVKVDYFPHVTQTGKTIAILEARWGNDGYAFWFKTLELLGSSESFCYDCNKPSDWEYLLSKTRVTEALATDILKKLAEIDAIDAELWAEKIIWSDHFASNLQPMFDKRKSAPPKKPEFPERKFGEEDISGSLRDENSSAAAFPAEEIRKVKESKAEHRKGETTTPLPPVEIPSETGSVDEVVASEDFASVVQLLTQNICPVTSCIEADTVREWTETLPREWVAQAIRQAALSKARSIKYVDKILQSWHTKYRSEEQPWLEEQRKMRASPKKTFIDQLADMAREDEKL